MRAFGLQGTLSPHFREHVTSPFPYSHFLPQTAIFSVEKKKSNLNFFLKILEMPQGKYRVKLTSI